MPDFHPDGQERYIHGSRNNVLWLLERFKQQAHPAKSIRWKLYAWRAVLTSSRFAYFSLVYETFFFFFFSLSLSLLFFLLFSCSFFLWKHDRLVVRAGSFCLLTRTQSRGDYETNELQVARNGSLIVKFGLVKSDGWTDNEIPSMPWSFVFKYFYGNQSFTIGRETMIVVWVSINPRIVNSSRFLIVIVECRTTLENIFHVLKIIIEYLEISIFLCSRQSFYHIFITMIDQKILLHIVRIWKRNYFYT